MGGGVADSSTLASQVSNFDPIVINSVLNVDGSVGNGPVGQQAFAQATGGTFALGLGFQNLEFSQNVNKFIDSKPYNSNKPVHKLQNLEQ